MRDQSGEGGEIRTFKSGSDHVKTLDSRGAPHLLVLPLWRSCVAGPAAGGRTAKVVFKELIMEPQCTSGAFKISRIKCLPPFHAPALFFHVVSPPPHPTPSPPSKGHNEGSVWMQLSITSSTLKGILEFRGARCSSSTHAVILRRRKTEARPRRKYWVRKVRGGEKKKKHT